MPLVLVPTPIGNLKDMTLRALEVLQGCHVVACEDTRRTLKLLNHYGIKKPLISLHEHNEVMRLGKMKEMLSEGLLVALVSDAGMPGISDPGEMVVKMAIEEGFPVDVLPGPSAVLTALVMSGLGARRFTFEGFLEGRRSSKEARLRVLRDREETLVFYVSPHRLEDDLSLMMKVLGDRPAALVREISKLHQEVLREPLSGLLEICGREPLRGEMVLVVSGADSSSGGLGGLGAAGSEGWEEAAKALLEAGLGVKEAAERINREMGVPKNRVKEFLLGLLRGSR
ncbi:MAG: 16S rRNA (cytidine(1402)-2'-O)-methyltransferase [Thermanaerothrix sp.]|nr:16S rRNA (cytidine(1402)-2'-O)-methyltransferase [Thermanaerothrix sp.]